MIGVAATLVMAVYAVIDPADRYISLFFVMLGLAMTWRHDLVWSRNRKRASA